ncbi:MAG: hypothetical protein ACI4W2_06880 [Eubacterium sp.]
MKSAAGGFCVILMTVILFIGMADIHQYDQTRREVSRAMNYACMTAQEEALENSSSCRSEDTYSQAFQYALRKCLPKNRNRLYKLRVYTADPEKHLLDAELTANWRTFSGQMKSISERRTVISEEKENIQDTSEDKEAADKDKN